MAPSSPAPRKSSDDGLSAVAPGGAPIVVNLRAIQFQWDFYAPGIFGGPDIILTAGQTYEFRIYNGDFKGFDAHGFSGVSAIGLPGGAILLSGAPPTVYTVTPTTVGGPWVFVCTNFCGIGHDIMLGSIRVVPGICTPAVSGISPTWGPTAGGSLVTISGSCFAAGATVAFGASPATGVTVTGSTVITATAPAHAAGSVPVAVTNPDARSATVLNGFRYGSTGFFTLVPCRVIDTRESPGPLGGPALTSGADRTFPASGACGIPSSARALSTNVTVTQASAPGHLSLFPGSTPLSSVSTINYGAGQTRANNALLPLDGAGALGVRNGQASGTAHLLVDVTGYFQ